MLELIGNGTIGMASATSFSLSPEGVDEFGRNIDLYRERIVLRPQDISNHPENLQMLQAIKGIAQVYGTQLIAEGIETQDDLRALRDLDIPYGQGWLLGRPAAVPVEELSA